VDRLTTEANGKATEAVQKGLEAMGGADVPSGQLDDVLDQLNEAADSNLGIGDTGSMDELRNKVNTAEATGKDAINKLMKYLKGFSEAIGEKVSEKLSANDPSVSESVNTKIEALQKQIEDLKNKYQDDVGSKITDTEAGDLKDSIKDIIEEMDKAENTEDSERASSTDGEDGKTKWDKNKVLKLLSILLALGGAFGLFFGLSLIAKELSGCYKYSGTDSAKIACPTDEGDCGCGNNSLINDAKDIADLQAICNKTGKYSTLADQSKYPWCCSTASVAFPTCTSSMGDSDSIYYAYKKYTPAGLLASLPSALINLANQAGGGIGKLLMTVLKWVGIAFVILIGVGIIYEVGKMIIERMGSKSGESKVESRK
jgi:hypothetical protein